ncbi:MAG: glycosyltransferase family 4 protein [Chloroflexota bacterium]
MSPRKTRIGIDGRYIQDQYHGIGRYTFELLRHMIAMAPEFTFVVFWDASCLNTRFDLAGVLRRPGVESVPVPLPLYGPRAQLALPFLAWRRRLDLFHAPFFGFPLLVPCPLVVTVHDLIFERYPEYMSIRWAYLYYRLLMTLGLARASGVTVVSEATRSDLCRYYALPFAKVKVAPPASDEHFKPAAPEVVEAVRRRYGLPDAFILNVGARRPNKNLGAVVRALGRIRDELPHSLVLVGERDRRFPDEVRAVAEQAGLLDRIYELGKVPEADLPGLYSAASALVFPSIIEGFGSPVHEALACGVPVITSNCSSLPEVAGDAAVLIDPTDEAQLVDALRRVLTDVQLAAELRVRGPRQAARFSWARAADLTLQLYDAVLGVSYQRQPPPPAEVLVPAAI